MKIPSLTLKCTLAAVLLGATFASHAATNTFVTPGFRGQAGSSAAYWDTFTNAYGGANTPNGIPLGGLTLANATLTQTADTNAFLTPNIYSFAGVTGFILDYSGVTDVGQIVFQTRTLANPMDYNSVALTYDIGGGPVSLYASRIALTDLTGGASSEWDWDLTGLGVSDFTIAFNASDISMSFDAGMLDVAVPEPGTVALFGLAAVGLAWRRFVRR